MIRTKAIEIVVGFLKQRLPAPITGQIDGGLSGSAGSETLKGLGGLGKV